MLDPYGTLGVSSTATTDQIKSAYRRIARETHPDLQPGSPESAERFRRATDAYAILSDPAQRRRFDESGSVDQAGIAATTEAILSQITHVRVIAESAKARARASALRGLAWLVAGAAITAIGYSSAASSSGSSYFVMWGAILFGGLQALRGFAAYFRIDARLHEIERDLWSSVTDSAVDDEASVAAAERPPTPESPQMPSAPDLGGPPILKSARFPMARVVAVAVTVFFVIASIAAMVGSGSSGPSYSAVDRQVSPATESTPAASASSGVRAPLGTAPESFREFGPDSAKK